MTDLCLSDAEERFFIAEVGFDIPAPEVILEEFLERELSICADEISWFAIEQFGVFSKSIRERSDNHKSQIMPVACWAPSDGSDGFDAEVVLFATGICVDCLPGSIRVLSQLLWGGQLWSVDSVSTLGLLLVWESVYFGVCPDSPDHGGMFRQAGEKGPVGIASINYSHHGTRVNGRVGIQLLA